MNDDPHLDPDLYASNGYWRRELADAEGAEARASVVCMAASELLAGSNPHAQIEMGIGRLLDMGASTEDLEHGRKLFIERFPDLPSAVAVQTGKIRLAGLDMFSAAIARTTG